MVQTGTQNIHCRLISFLSVSEEKVELCDNYVDFIKSFPTDPLVAKTTVNQFHCVKRNSEAVGTLHCYIL